MYPADSVPREPPDAIRYVHRAIVEAIIHRDVAQSARLMRKHLRAATDEGQPAAPITPMAMLAR
jgi:DNA-binding GntR family transcriptional regulator